MNKKGFTLVELLAVLTVLALIMLVTIPNFIGSIKKNKDLTYKSNVQDIILAASSYNSIHTGKVTQVSVEDLKKEGFITTNIINPYDNSEMNGCVYIINGEYTYQEKTCTTIFGN